MAKQILLKHGVRKKLMRAMKTTYPTISAALRYESYTEIAKKIRHTAVKEYGGIEINY